MVYTQDVSQDVVFQSLCIWSRAFCSDRSRVEYIYEAKKPVQVLLQSWHID